MTARKPLLLGHFGGSNAGDEAILDGTCHLFSSIGVDAVRIVGRGRDYVPNVTASVSVEVVRTSVPAVVRALLGASSVVLAGGTHFNDDFAFTRRLRHYRYLARYVGVLACARLLRRPVVALGQGIGPLRHPTGRLLARLLFALVPSGTVRDDASLADARALGATAWQRTFDSAAASGHCWRDGEHETTNVAIAPVHGTAAPRLWNACATALAIAYDQGDVGRVSVVVFRSGDREDDGALAQEVASAIASDVPVERTTFDGDLDLIVDAFEQSRVVLCGRYHALVLALLAGAVPVVLPAHRKLRDLAALVGLPSSLVVLESAPEALTAAIGAAVEFDARKLQPVLDDLRLSLVIDAGLLAQAEGQS